MPKKSISSKKQHKMGTVFQKEHPNKRAFLLSSCSPWVIVVVSCSWFIQASSLTAMEPEEFECSSVKVGNKKSSITTNGFYKDSEHPQMGEFWKTKDLSKRLEKIKYHSVKIQEKITNYKTNSITITPEDLIKYKNIFKCTPSDTAIVQGFNDITHADLLIGSEDSKKKAGGWSDAEVIVLPGLRLMYENPTVDSLNSIKQGELGLFCEGDKLFCKIHNKDKMQILRSDGHNTQGYNPESFARIVKILQEGGEAMTATDEDTLFQFTSLYGYTNYKVAIKKFKNINEGLEELLYSLTALDINPSPKEIKMARIWDAALSSENSKDCLSIIMECANGQDIHNILSKDNLSTNFSSNAIKACAEYLAIFHIRNYKKLKKDINRGKYLAYAAKPVHTIAHNPLNEEDENKPKIPSFSLFVKKPLLEIEEQLTEFEKIQSDNVLRLLSQESQEKFIYFAKKSRDQFVENSSELFRAIKCWGTKKEKTYFLTITHGDAHGNNFFYNNSTQLLYEGQTSIREDSFYRITMIDFASIIKTYGDIGDPAEDVGRFLGSLWDWAAKQDDPLSKYYQKISRLQEQFVQSYMKKIEESAIFKKENKKLFKRIFEENYNFYKLRFYRIITNAEKDKIPEKDKSIKKKILKSWIKENIALESSLQKKPKKIIERKKSSDRDWKPACTNQQNIIHYIPEQSDVFIESAIEGEKESYLTRLWKMLEDKGNVTLFSRAAIAGMGGVGKTSLALEYAHEALANKAYKLIYWIPSGAEFSLMKHYRELLQEIGESINGKDDDAIINLIKEKIPEQGKCLLIYDNVPDATFLKNKVPEHKNTHVLVTSRCNEGWGASTLNLDVFRADESIQYLFDVTGLGGLEPTYDDEKIVKQLAEALHHFPLALAHAAYYLKLVGGEDVSEQHFKRYIEALEEGIEKGSLIHFEENINYLETEKSKITYENLIGRTLRISSGKLSDLENELMVYSAYLSSDAIEEEIFLEYWEGLNQKKHEKAQTLDSEAISESIDDKRKKLKKALSLLSDLSLINREESKSLFSIHRLAQLVIRNEKESKSPQQNQEVIKNLAHIFNRVFEKNINTPEQVDKIMNYLPHVIQLFEHSRNLKIVCPEAERLEWIEKVIFISLYHQLKFPQYLLDNKNNKWKEILKFSQYLFKHHSTKSDDFPKWLLEIAERAHPIIQVPLGIIYQEGEYVTQDYKKAFEWFTKAANQGDGIAQYHLGSMCKNGIGIPKDEKQAFECYKKAAKQGYPDAQFMLACIKGEWDEVNQKDTEKINWIRKAAKQGMPEAEYTLGFMYSKGDKVNQNSIKAFKYYQKAAKQGFREAQYELSEIYKVGQNYSESVKWLKEAANQNLAIAQYELGKMHEKGYGVKQNYHEAIKWYKKAAKQGSTTPQLYSLAAPKAQLKIGLIYYEGFKNEDKAFKWYTKAAESGNAGVQNMLGQLYVQRMMFMYQMQNAPWEEIIKYQNQAIKWLDEAAQQEYAEAQCLLGTMYFFALGGAKNDKKAFHWHTKAAERGNRHAQFMVKNMYIQERGTMQNLEKAARWFIEADKQQDSMAPYIISAMTIYLNAPQDDITSMYRNNHPRNLSADDVKMIEEFTVAAKKGDVFAQYNLGMMYVNGDYVAKNDFKAFKWFFKAAKGGDAKCQYALGKLYIERMKNAPENEIVTYQTETTRWIKAAAKQGLPEAHYALGDLYEKVQNYEEAFKWYKKAVKLGPLVAQLHNKEDPQLYYKIMTKVGLMYYYGEGVDKNENKAIKCLTIVAEYGKAECQYTLGEIYIKRMDRLEKMGDVTENEIDKCNIEAMRWIKAAAKQGHKKAKSLLALEEKILCKEDDLYRALKHIGIIEDLRMAAKQGDVLAHYHLGQIYLNGEYTDRDDFEALTWFQKAANQGFSEAQIIVDHVSPHLQFLIDRIKNTENSFYNSLQDFENEGEDTYALKGSYNSFTMGGTKKANYSLAKDFVGEEEEKYFLLEDAKLAKKLQKEEQRYVDFQYRSKWMPQTNKKSFATTTTSTTSTTTTISTCPSQPAITLSPSISSQGQKGSTSSAHDETTKWSSKTAEQVEGETLYNLSLKHKIALGEIEKSDNGLIKRCKMNAKQGDAEAQNSLGLMYQTGQNVEKNIMKAIKWFTRAAEQENACAQFNLGLIYANNRGKLKNNIEAIKWLTKAANQGHPLAELKIGIMYSANIENEQFELNLETSLTNKNHIHEIPLNDNKK